MGWVGVVHFACDVWKGPRGFFDGGYCSGNLSQLQHAGSKSDIDISVQIALDQVNVYISVPKYPQRCDWRSSASRLPDLLLR